MTRSNRAMWALTACSMAFMGLFLCGCPFIPTPPPEAVLAGDWEGTTQDGSPLRVRFSDNGQLLGFLTTGEGDNLVLVTPSNSQTTLVGSDVTVVVTVDATSATYEATLSADQNTLDGTVTQTISIGDDITVILPQGDLTLTRVEEPDGNDNDNGNDNGGPNPAETFPTSLHDANFKGMEYFYSADQGGIELLTGVAYGDDRLDCHVCHDKSRFENADPPVEWPGTDSCFNCHDDLADPSAGIDETRCLGCHGRQGAERGSLALSDVHRDGGFVCMDCHLLSEMHGDGVVYNSFLESPSIKCADCHAEGGAAPAPPVTVPEHATHAANIDCSSCHMQSVITCYNCHFDTQLAGAGKRAFSQRKDYMLLVNRDGMVHPATFMTLVYEQNTFNVVAPYYAHSISETGRTCSDCHVNFGGDIPAITEYNATGTMTLTTWDDAAEGAARLIGPSGIIPVPQDWADAFQFAWLDYTGDPTTPVPDTDPALWMNIENGPAATTQILFATPLTDAQMGSLGATGP